MPTLEFPVTEETMDVPREKPVRRAPISRSLRVLSVSPTFEDHATLRRILDSPEWQVATVDSCKEAAAFLRQTGILVVFCEHSLPDGSWRQVLEEAAGSPIPPLIVVTSRLADDRLWAEVLNVGGFDVLAKPFNEREVRHVMASALSHRLHPVTRARSAEIA